MRKTEVLPKAIVFGQTNEQKTSKNISDFIKYNLRKDYHILTIFNSNVFHTTGYQKVVQVCASPNVCFCTTWEKQNGQNMHQNKPKKVNKFNISGSVGPSCWSNTFFNCRAAM